MPSSLKTIVAIISNESKCGFSGEVEVGSCLKLVTTPGKSSFAVFDQVFRCIIIVCFSGRKIFPCKIAVAQVNAKRQIDLFRFFIEGGIQLLLIVGADHGIDNTVNAGLSVFLHDHIDDTGHSIRIISGRRVCYDFNILNG